jgi:hypothetical protein
LQVLLNAGANLSALDVFDWSPIEMARNLMHTKQHDAIALLRQHERLAHSSRQQRQQTLSCDGHWSQRAHGVGHQIRLNDIFIHCLGW